MNTGTVKQGIPKNNIKAYGHWYYLLKEIQAMSFKKLDFEKPLKALRKRQKKHYGRTRDWLWQKWVDVCHPFNAQTGERFVNLSDPFRQVQQQMIHGREMASEPGPPLSPVLYPTLARMVVREQKETFTYPDMKDTGGSTIRDYAKKREGKPVRNWGYNVVVSALIEDSHWYGKGIRFAEVASILNVDYDTLRGHYKGIDQHDIMHILRALCRACAEKGVPFIPEEVTIEEWPVDFLATVAHVTGYKINPYLSGEKHLTDEIKESLPKHLQWLLTRK